MSFATMSDPGADMNELVMSALASIPSFKYAPRTDPAMDEKPDVMTQKISEYVMWSMYGLKSDYQNLHEAEKQYLIRSGDSAIPTKIFPTQATASDWVQLQVAVSAKESKFMTKSMTPIL